MLSRRLEFKNTYIIIIINYTLIMNSKQNLNCLKINTIKMPIMNETADDAVHGLDYEIGG